MSSNWTPRDSPVNNIDLSNGGYGFVCAIKDGTDEAIAAGWDDDALVWVIRTLDGGVTWSVASDYKLDAQGSQPEEAYYSSLFNRYYIGAYNDEDGAVLIGSADGDSWDEHLTVNGGFSGVNYQGIVDAPSLGICAAVGRGNTTYSFHKTTNGTAWTQNDSDLNAYPMRDLAWSEDLGLFAACQQFRTGAAPKVVWTSPDGVTWTGRTTPISDATFFNTQTINWLPVNQCFMMSASNSSFASILKSVDGINWTTSYSPSNGRAQSILELSDGRIFADNGGYYVVSSDGGANWIQVNWEDPVYGVNMMDSDPAFGEILITGYAQRYSRVGYPLYPQMVITGPLPPEAGLDSVSFDDVILPQ